MGYSFGSLVFSLIAVGCLVGACGVCTYNYIDKKIDVDVEVKYND